MKICRIVIMQSLLNHMKHVYLTGFMLFLLTTSSLAQVDSSKKQDSEPDYYAMSLEELMSIKTSDLSSELEQLINSLIGVASKKPLSARNSPSIVSLVTDEEIRNSGARDLIDVLRLVPGFDFGVDVEGVVGLGVRGNWAQEGKVLLMLDGLEINETMFSSLAFGNRFDVNQIKKIEIIRGPGSSIYGGFAEYGVINIITRSASDLKGISVSGTYGQFSDTYARRNLSISAGQEFGKLGVSVGAFFGQGQRSNQPYTDFLHGTADINTIYRPDGSVERIDTSYHDTRYNMAGNSALNPASINLGLSYGNLRFRGFIENYSMTTRDMYGEAAPEASHLNFRSYMGELIYTWKYSQKLTVTPQLSYKRQMPWQEEDVYNMVADRYRGKITANYDAKPWMNVVFGAESFNDRAFSRFPEYRFYNNENLVSFVNTAAFTQFLFKTPIANITAGARYDYNSAFGSAFVPRLGVTRKFSNLHLKLLYSSAFRAPAIENINLNADGTISPERTQVVEIEAGYQLNRSMILTANIFDITTKDPIVYYAVLHPNNEYEEGYANFHRTGSRGLEVEYRWKEKWGYVNANYAYYTNAGKNTVEYYAVASNPNSLLGFANHKINLNSSFRLAKGLSLNPSVNLIGKRYSNGGLDEDGEYIEKEWAPMYLANLFLQKRNFLVEGLDAGIGVYDLFNQKSVFLQPLWGDHAGLPGPAREFIVRVSYTLKGNAGR
jgi:outer membrane cobalamin receptor